MVAASGLLTTASDVDSPTLNAVAGTFPTANGSTVIIAADGGFTFAPKANFNGLDRFTYTISDGVANVTGTATVSVAAVNVSPRITLCRPALLLPCFLLPCAVCCRPAMHKPPRLSASYEAPALPMQSCLTPSCDCTHVIRTPPRLRAHRCTTLPRGRT